MKRIVYLIFYVLMVLSLGSCATASMSKYHGIGRLKTYDFYSADLPEEFEGFRVAFATDFHYSNGYSINWT